METLSKTLQRLFKNKGYIYYKKMIDDYIKGDWYFNIKKLVTYKTIMQNVSPCFTSKGYKTLRTRVVIDLEMFEEKMLEYYNKHIIPIQIIKNEKLLARKAFIKKIGFVTLGNQMCQNANYECSNCLNFKNGCEIAMKYTNDNPNLKRMTKILETLYGNLRNEICEIQVKEGLKYL